MLADIICNTFYSKNSRRKFTDEDRQLIDDLYEEQYVFSVFENDVYFVLDGISYPYLLAISALLVILLLTAPSYMEPQTAPRLWFFFLLIEAIGYLAVSANNVTFFIYGYYTIYSRRAERNMVEYTR